MSREIKFRVWSKSDNKFVCAWLESLRFTLDTGQIYVNGTNFTDNYILCQYTGLKDKNGGGSTEVYEGDIISVCGILKGNIYENDKEPTDIVIPQLGTKAWNDAYKEAVDRGYDYSK